MAKLSPEKSWLRTVPEGIPFMTPVGVFCLMSHMATAFLLHVINWSSVGWMDIDSTMLVCYLKSLTYLPSYRDYLRTTLSMDKTLTLGATNTVSLLCVNLVSEHPYFFRC